MLLEILVPASFRRYSELSLIQSNTVWSMLSSARGALDILIRFRSIL